MRNIRSAVKGGGLGATRLSGSQINAIKASPKGQLPSFLRSVTPRVGASVTRTKDGSELQAGVRTRGGTGIHVGAGYSKSRKSAGLDVTLTRGRKRVGSFGVSGRR